MEGELWNGLYTLVAQVSKTHYQPPRKQHPDSSIVLVLAWAGLHDRPVSWAVQAANWPSRRPPIPLPSSATISRRRRTLSVLSLLAEVERSLRADHPRSLVRSVDAMPLVVGGWSKDRDARRGWAVNSYARGYKLCAIVDGQSIVAWRLGPMNLCEPEQAGRLLEEIEPGGYLLGDALYDTNPLHHQAAQRQIQLVAPRKKPGRGLGSRMHEPSRLRSIALLEGNSAFGRQLYAMRTGIERVFGNVGCFPGGLGPLPRFVRRPLRVALWIQIKIIIYGVHCRLRRTAA
jgi:hypothetical protein